MRIAFILSYSVFAPTNGIVSQALTWKKGLEMLGHEVVLIDMWQKNDWKGFDIIHFFNFSQYMAGFIKVVHKVNPRIVVSPILDPNYSVRMLKLYSHWGSQKFRLTNPFYELRSVKHHIKMFLARSGFEENYMIEGFGLQRSQCRIVPLSYGVTPPDNMPEKDNFCLHISLLCDGRKNVKRLIDAAEKYRFRLILGGKLRNEEEKNTFGKWIEGKSMIEYRGYLSDEEITDLYSRAKVFALPSITEGVGIVALEAAAFGCNIVVTRLGGPQEYYGDKAMVIDPYNVDEIGCAVKDFLDDKKTFQPGLSESVREKFSLNAIAATLVDAYKAIL
ncbi:MAG: glycosyltransferase family 4 protein [Dysgonomonas sp.]